MTTQQQLADEIASLISNQGYDLELRDGSPNDPIKVFQDDERNVIVTALRAPPNIGDATEALRDSLRLAIDNIQGIADGTDAPSIVIRERARALLAGKPSPNIGDAPRKESLLQIRGFAAVMDEHNWRDIKLHIERQCDDALRSNIGDACGGPNYLQALLTERLEVDRLRRDCAELYQVIGTLSEPHGPLFDDPQVIKALDNASAAANAAPRLHDDLLPFALTTAQPAGDECAPSSPGRESVVRHILNPIVPKGGRDDPQYLEAFRRCNIALSLRAAALDAHPTAAEETLMMQGFRAPHDDGE